MSAAIVKAAALAAAVVSLTPPAALAQDSGTAKSERGMPEKTGATDGKSERAMPDQTKETGTAPAKAERAMPSPDKK